MSKIIKTCCLIFICFTFTTAQAISPSSVQFFYEPKLMDIYGIHGYQKLTFPWGDQILPPSYDGNTIDGIQGNFLHIYSRKPFKQNESNLWLTFKIISTNFFKTGGHLAVVGKADNSTRINTGQGLIIGRNIRSDSGPVCSDFGIGSGWVQPEIWWSLSAQNNIVQDSWVGGGVYCNKLPLFDGKIYAVTIQYGANGYYYVVQDDSFHIIASNYIVDEYSDNFYVGLTSFGVTFGIVFGHAEFSWDFKLFDISSGEF